MIRLSDRLTFANVTSLLALFVALGGTSYAAITLKRNSVKSKHIANGQVKSPDIGRSAVTGVKVKDGSLRLADFAAGQLPAGARGETGPQGPPGPTAGDVQGPRGSATLPIGTVIATATVDAPAPGKLLVFGHGGDGPTFSCSSACAIQMNIFVDGQAVPGTIHTGVGSCPGPGCQVETNYDGYGIVPSVGAGRHTVQLAWSTNSPGLITSPANFFEAQVGGIALGG